MDKYCILTATQHAFNKKVDIVIDFGEQELPIEYQDFEKNCTSLVEALNFMSSKGWELVNSYANQILYETRHVMKKGA